MEQPEVDPSAVEVSEIAFDHEELRVFWDLARFHAKLNAAPTYFGPTTLESVPPPAWAYGESAEQSDAFVAQVLADERGSTTATEADYDGELPQAGVLSILLAMAVGVPAGLVSGYYRGTVDQLIMRLTDAWLSFPFLILAIGLVTILGPSLTNATLAIGLGATPTYVRLTRGLVLATREEDFVQGARALGAGDGRVMAWHVLPNIVSAILVQATVSVPTAVIAEAVLSFLGLGAQPPQPSWGTMLNTAQQFLETAPWMAWWPGSLRSPL